MTIDDGQGIDGRQGGTIGKIANMTVGQRCGDHVKEVICSVVEKDPCCQRRGRDVVDVPGSESQRP